MEKTENNWQVLQRWGPVVIYLLLGAASVAIDLFCRGTLSPCFLYPLSGGALHLLLAVFLTEAGKSESYPIFLGLTNAGILLLTVNQTVADIFEMTGRISSYSCLTAIVGWTLTAAGILVLAMVVWDVRESGKYKKRRNKENREGKVKEEHHE